MAQTLLSVPISSLCNQHRQECLCHTKPQSRNTPHCRRKLGETRTISGAQKSALPSAGHRGPWVVVSDPESPFAAESARPVPAIQAGPLRGVMFAQPRVARAVVMSCYASFSHARSFRNGTRSRSLLRNQRRLSSSTSRQSCTPGCSWQPDVPLSCERTSHT